MKKKAVWMIALVLLFTLAALRSGRGSTEE